MQLLFLDKSQKDRVLPALFDLFYENMDPIAPFAHSYEEEKALWLGEVSPALDKAPRQILLCRDGDRIAGYVQFYVREKLLMVEEVQLEKHYQRTTLFLRLCRFLAAALPEDLQTVEAFAHKENAPSIRLMERLGMVICGEQAGFVHLRGRADRLQAVFGR